MSSSSSSPPLKQPRVPIGFSLINGPNDEAIIVPSFMVLSTENAISIDYSKDLLNVEEAAGGPRSFDNVPQQTIAEGMVRIPANPEFSERENLILHAEIKALQSLLGISYKDAAHRLYMKEVEKLKNERLTEKNCRKIRDHIDNTISTDLEGPIKEIDTEVTGNKDN